MTTFLVPGENTHNRNDFQGILRSISRKRAKMLHFGDFQVFSMEHRKSGDFLISGPKGASKAYEIACIFICFPPGAGKVGISAHFRDSPTFSGKVRNVMKSTKVVDVRK